MKKGFCEECHCTMGGHRDGCSNIPERLCECGTAYLHGDEEKCKDCVAEENKDNDNDD